MAILRQLRFRMRLRRGPAVHSVGKEPREIMRKTAYGVALAMTFIGTMIAAQKKAIREPKTFALDCSAGDCPLLKGVPQTRSMRGGSVEAEARRECRLALDCGEEEALVILKGSGVANIEGQPDVPLSEKMLAYIPPATRHNVTRFCC